MSKEQKEEANYTDITIIFSMVMFFGFKTQIYQKIYLSIDFFEWIVNNFGINGDFEESMYYIMNTPIRNNDTNRDDDQYLCAICPISMGLGER